MEPTNKLTVAQNFGLWTRFRRNQLTIAPPDKTRWGAVIFLTWALGAIIAYGLLTAAGATHWVWRPAISGAVPLVMMVTALAEIIAFHIFVRLYRQWPIFIEPLWPGDAPAEPAEEPEATREDLLSSHED